MQKGDKMSTLTEMLNDKEEEPGGGVPIPDALEVFKDWLKTVGLTDYYSSNRDGVEFNTTESLRQLLIALVDEP